MGIALTEECIRRGWPTTLLLGPTTVSPPEHTQLLTLRFQTTADLQALLTKHWPQHDVLIMAAAVADFRPKFFDESAKLRRSDKSLTLELEPTPDLLAGLAAVTTNYQRIIGFALEPAERLIASARDKLVRKKLDAIVANPLETMDAPDASATVIFKDGRTVTSPDRMPKADFAKWFLQTLDPLILQK
jgi:phosphopantothenoylcysteine decarboxylase / phosphopantothenate---cysteine ligase